MKVYLPRDADEDEGEHFGVGEIVLDLQQEIGEEAGRDGGLEEAAKTDAMASTKSIPLRENFQDNIKKFIFIYVSIQEDDDSSYQCGPSDAVAVDEAEEEEAYCC